MSDSARYRIVLALLSAATAALFVLSLVIGPAGLGISDALASLYSGGDEGIGLIMREIRLPRAILGLMIGVTLGLSGAALQGYLRNPLAEPGLLGISASASLGAVIAIYTGLSAAFPLGLPLAALAGSVVAVLVVQAMAGASGGALPENGFEALTLRGDEEVALFDVLGADADSGGFPVPRARPARYGGGFGGRP